MEGLGRKASLLAAVAVISTALFGSAYTLWYQDLSTKTDIATATLDASITCLNPADNESATWPPPGIGGVFQAYPVAAIVKDVASASLVTQTDVHRVDLLISNAYPVYAWDCEIHARNTTSLPWHLEDIKITVLQCDANGNNCVPLNTPTGQWTTNCVYVDGECTWGNMGINPPNYPQGLSSWSPLFVDVTDWEGCQVHNTSAFGLSGSFFVGVNQSAKQNTTYKLTVEYQANQWNESNYTGVCGQLKPGATGPMLSQLQ